MRSVVLPEWYCIQKPTAVKGLVGKVPFSARNGNLVETSKEYPHLWYSEVVYPVDNNGQAKNLTKKILEMRNP